MEFDKGDPEETPAVHQITLERIAQYTGVPHRPLPEPYDDRPFGSCPECGAPGIARERRLGGNDICQEGHHYPSAMAIEPEECPCELTEAIEGDVVPGKPPPGLGKIPSREELTAQTAARVADLTEQLADAVIDDDKPAQKRLVREITQTQRNAGFAANVLGLLGVFDPSIHGTPPHGAPGEGAQIKPEAPDAGH